MKNNLEKEVRDEKIARIIKEFRKEFEIDQFPDIILRDDIEKWIEKALSTAHRNGVEEERERLLNQKANAHDEEVRKLAAPKEKQKGFIEGAESMKAKALAIAEKYIGTEHFDAIKMCVACRNAAAKEIKKELDALDALNNLTP